MIRCLIFSAIFLLAVRSADVKISNLDDTCMKCLCIAATGCNVTLGCAEGYCGPFKIGRVYWVDSGKVTLPDDEPQRSGAYEDCALSYPCAQRIITGYLSMFGKDCDGNGVTNCMDYAMINFNGGYRCDPPLSRNEDGRAWLARFMSCYDPAKG